MISYSKDRKYEFALLLLSNDTPAPTQLSAQTTSTTTAPTPLSLVNASFTTLSVAPMCTPPLSVVTLTTTILEGIKKKK